MTRETKIGLLVGLAFIIVIGILLSDHLTASTEPPPAPMAGAGSTVRGSVSTPVVATQPPVSVIAPPQAQPTQTVPTAADLSPKPQPVKIVQIPTPQNEPVTITQDQTQDITLASKPLASAPDQQTTPAALPRASLPSPAAPPSAQKLDPVLAQINAEAQKRGESIIPVGPGTLSQMTPAAGASKTYKAEPGDHLSRIAQKFYGSNAKIYRDAIVEANPSLKDNPNLIIEGKTYAIPGVKPEASTASPSIANAAKTTDPAPAPVASEAIYVVQEGDNLTRIARDQVGAADAVPAIKELNRDLLKGSDVIRPGMKLKLPARSVAVNTNS